MPFNEKGIAVNIIITKSDILKFEVILFEKKMITNASNKPCNANIMVMSPNETT